MQLGRIVTVLRVIRPLDFQRVPVVFLGDGSAVDLLWRASGVPLLALARIRGGGGGDATPPRVFSGMAAERLGGSH